MKAVGLADDEARGRSWSALGDLGGPGLPIGGAVERWWRHTLGAMAAEVREGRACRRAARRDRNVPAMRAAVVVQDRLGSDSRSRGRRRRDG